MNIQQFRHVHAIAQAGSFSEAAKQLYVTQPNLSASIRDLETELGIKLFTRSNTGAKLTENGHDFLKYAQRILGEVQLLEERYRQDFKKTFTVASHHYDFLSLAMTHIAPQFEDEYQEFQIIETTTRRVLDSVANFESDLGIIYLDDDNRTQLERQITDLDLNFMPLGQFGTRIFLGKQHPLASRKELTTKDLADFPTVRFRQDRSGIHFDEDALSILEKQTVFYANDRGTVMNLLTSSQAYASGLGIVNSFIQEQITLIPLKDSPLHTLGVVSSNKQKSSAISQAFIEKVRYYSNTTIQERD